MEPIDWDGTVQRESRHGRLLNFLHTLPQTRWTECDPWSATLLHHACQGDNTAAAVALLTHGASVDACDSLRRAPAFWAAHWGQSRVLEVLCAGGARVQMRDCQGRRALDAALVRSPECVRVLVANGARLSSAHETGRHRITPELEAFERGVLRCRAAVAAMLRVKRASRRLVCWDKFLLIEMAVCVWSTRAEVAW